MKRLLTITSVFLLALSSHAEDFVQTLARTTTYIEMLHPVWEQNGTNRLQVFYKVPGTNQFNPKLNSVTGTAFLISHKKGIYIVTAAHVVGDPADHGILHLVDTNGIRQNIDLVDIRNNFPSARWFIHTNADIAIHPYAHRTDQYLENSCLAEEQFVSTNELPLLTPVIALGFPLSLGTFGAKISPVATASETSSWQTVVPGEKENQTFILLDKALAQGYSGAPIFTRPQELNLSGLHAGGGPYMLIGICHSELSDVAGGKHSTIVPISCLVELFNQPDFLQYEATLK